MAQDRPRIMVVDDDPGMRITLEGILEDEGFEVVGVEDGHRAIDLAKDTRFALILMDIKMPGINGVDAYKEIKKVSPESVVVMLTGYSVEGLVKEALAEGAYAVVYKPFAVEQLMDIVHTILDTSCVLVVDDRSPRWCPGSRPLPPGARWARDEPRCLRDAPGPRRPCS